MAMFSNGGWTSPDIWLLLSIVLIAALSLVLNPLVFKHNYYKKRSIARDLFMVLSATDFVSSLVMTIAFGLSIAAPIEKQCTIDHNLTFCQTSYFKYNRTATIIEKAVGGVMWSLGFIPIIIAAVQAITRWYQISYPLRVLSRKTVELMLAILCLIFVTYCQRFYVRDSQENPAVFKMNMQIVSYYFLLSIEGILPFILLIGLTSISSIASTCTVWNIAKSDNVAGNGQRRRNKMKSSQKIALMNAGALVWDIIVIARVSTDVTSDISLIIQSLLTFLPLLLSTYNPVIYVLLTDRLLNNSRGRGAN